MPRSTPRRVRVLVADEQPLFRDALARFVRADPALELVAATGGAAFTRTAIARHRPDVIASDEALLEAALADRPRDARDGPHVLVLAGHPGTADLYLALERGAAGCLSKEASWIALRSAILATAEGRTSLDGAAQDRLGRAIRLRARDDRTPVLSPREGEVLAGIAAGRTTAEIAAQLHLGRPTVKTHMHRLYEKLGVTERAAAVAEAMRHGLLE